MTSSGTCTLCALRSSEWLLTYVDADATGEGIREALLTLGNGYLSTRGAVPEAAADGVHYPATYVAGVYNRLDSHVDGRQHRDESLVNLPNWLPLTMRADDGPWLAPGTWQVVHHHVALDLRRGLQLRELVVDDPSLRRTHIRQDRLVSMDAEHVACLRSTITPLNWSGTLHVRSLLNGQVRNDNVAAFAALAKQHLTVPVVGQHGDTCWLVAETVQSRVRVAIAASTTTSRDDAVIRPVSLPGQVGQEWTMPVEPGVPLTVDKIVAVFTSRDHAISEPLDAAKDELAHAPGYDRLRAAHTLAWEHLWQRLHLTIDIDTDRTSQTEEAVLARRAVNVHLFHVAQTLSGHTADLDVGVPARGLHGEGYRGHIFWDELFVFPMLNLRIPELTRALLLYRYRRLPQARRLANETGAVGALFPVAERQRRPRRDSQVALQPALTTVGGRQLPAAVPRQPGSGLQRLAVLPGHRRHRLPGCLRRGAAGRDRPVLGRDRRARPGNGPLPPARCDGTRRVPRRLPGPARRGHGRQRLHRGHDLLGSGQSPRDLCRC